MSGVEAGFVVGLIASVISIIEATKTVYDAAKDAKGQPEAFRQVAARLPLVTAILRKAKERTQTLGETAQEALEPTLESCKAKAEALQKIFQKVVRKDDDKWYDRYKKAVGTLGKQGRVEGLMEGVLKDIHVLACEKLMGTATGAEVKEIEEAMKQMKDMPSSLQDETGDALHQQHSGSGDNIGATGGSVLNLHKGTGDQYHNEIAGNAHFGSNSINPTFNISNNRGHQTDPQTYLKDLRATDPRDDKKRIEETKGGLLADSYRWILEHSDFQHWRDDKQSRLLWIKGDPGKGKTMLLCGIIDEISPLTKLRDEKATTLLSYFFCQATDERINNATAVLRGLIYLLIDQQPSLVSHVREKYDHGIERPFEGVNGWVALSTVFENILQDPSLKSTYLIVDALDECETDLPQLLKLVANCASTFPRVKWIVSSRNKPDIEARLRLDNAQMTLSLELNSEHVFRSVELFIDYKVSKLPLITDDSALQETVRHQIYTKAGGTFLWAALVLKELEPVESWDVLDMVQEMPPELEPLYDRMLRQVQQLQRKDPEFCRLVLSTMTLAYRPLHLLEVGALSGLPEQVSTNLDNVMKAVNKCGSFLTIRENRTYFIHQSAKDFLFGKAFDKVFPSGKAEVNYTMFSRSREIMSRTLRRDIYGLCAPGLSIDSVTPPDPDPLGAASYSCVYWFDHLCAIEIGHDKIGLGDNGVVHVFLKEHFLHWMEALSLLKSISNGILAINKLKSFLKTETLSNKSQLFDLIQDAYRFILFNRWVIENHPLQAYASALIFSPTCSLTRELFKDDEPGWIMTKPIMESNWSACLQTLEGHMDSVTSIAFSTDGTRLATASCDKTVRLWDALTGKQLQTLKGHTDWSTSVAFSTNGARLASASKDKTIRLWDTSTGEQLQTLEGHTHAVSSIALSTNSTRLASASNDKTVRLWDASTGEQLQTLKGHTHAVSSVAFSTDGTRLASASDDKTVRLWDTSTGEQLQTLKGHTHAVSSIAFSTNGTLLASASWDGTVRLWDVSTSEQLQTFKCHMDWVTSIAFSTDGTRLATASCDETVRLWDALTGEQLQTLKGHTHAVSSVAFSTDGTRLASASDDKTVRLWDASTSIQLQMLKGHTDSVTYVAFSTDGTRLASASDDETVRLWDASTGEQLQTLKGHTDSVTYIAFSTDGTRLASASNDKTVRLWDALTGEQLQTLNGHTLPVTSVVFSSNGIRLASASWDETVRLWDASTGEQLQMLKGHTHWVTYVAFSTNGTRLASASYDETIRLWDASTGEQLQTLKGHTHAVSSIAFSTDGTRLASASDDETIRLWNASTGEQLQTLEGHTMQSFVSESLLFNTEGVSSYCLREKSSWIAWNNNNILWLPPDYRSLYAMIKGHVFVTIVSGRAIIIKFKEDVNPLRE